MLRSTRQTQDDQTGFWELHSFDPGDRGVRAFSFKGYETSGFAIAEWEFGR